MGSVNQIEFGVDRYDLRSIRKRFLAINRERLRRTEDALRYRARDFLDLLPLLFHVNHAMLPGFVSRETPAGVSDWVAPRKSLEAGKRIAKSFDAKNRAPNSYDIHSIFLMGSVGTIAHSDKSDFDVWVCHRHDLTRSQRKELLEKCQSIETWTQSLGMEVHIFLMDAEGFRKGHVIELSSESSGSTQHHLLLEEFYRTSILVAGRYPVWWLVPPDEEANYDAYVKQLLGNNVVPQDEIIDFGGLGEIPVEEFFGAALWQVYKGIDSPYKSVLKMLLMEAYAAEYPHSDLLGLRYKRAIFEGEKDLDKLDPYSILIQKLEEYLQGRDEPERLDLIRRCFYFKVQLALSKSARTVNNWRWERMLQLTRVWKWDNAKIQMLDERDKWKVSQVLKERRILVDEITHSYMALSKFARSHADLARIEQKDLNVLGRKLYAAFERKAGKIETINRGISNNIVENQITIVQGRGRNNEELWSLHSGPREQVNKSRALKRSRSVLEVLAWCHFNRLLDERSIVSLAAGNGTISFRELTDILATLDELWPDGQLPPASIDNYARPPQVVRGCVFANIGIDPLARHSNRGASLISEKSDVINYSGFSLNLVQSFDLLVVTSWQEIITYRYTGIEGLLDCISQYLRWNASDEVNTTPPPLKAYSFSSSHGNAIASRIEQIYSEIFEIFFNPDGGRYVLQAEEVFYLVEAARGNIEHSKFDSFESLLDVLSETKSTISPIRVDENALNKTPLPVILTSNRSGRIQMFYQVTGKEVDVFIMDENGSLFYHRMPYYSDEALVNHYSRFFDSVLNRINYLTEQQEHTMQDVLDIYKIIQRGSKYGFDRQQYHSSTKMGYYNVQVIADLVNKNTAFTIYCNDEEFSSIDHGDDLFREVANYVMHKRSSDQSYPIYITDVDLSPSFIGSEGMDAARAIDYLKYKKRIECELNGELTDC